MAADATRPCTVARPCGRELQPDEINLHGIRARAAVYPWRIGTSAHHPGGANVFDVTDCDVTPPATPLPAEVCAHLVGVSQDVLDLFAYIDWLHRVLAHHGLDEWGRKETELPRGR